MSNLEIVGFDGGGQLAVCGRAMPVVHDKSTNMYFKLSASDNAATALRYNNADIQEFTKLGRVTLFAAPFPLGSKPMALFMRDELLKEADINPRSFELRWEAVQDGAIATCASEQTIEQLLNTVGTKLKEKIRLAVVIGNVDDAIRLSHMALYAARDQELRNTIYLCYALALLQQSRYADVDRLFRLFVSRENSTLNPLSRSQFDSKIAKLISEISKAREERKRKARKRKLVKIFRSQSQPPLKV